MSTEATPAEKTAAEELCRFLKEVTGAEFPNSAVTIGEIYAWKDARTCPDCVQTLLEYSEGFMVSYCTTFGNGSGNRTVMYGTQGVIDMTSRSKPIASNAGAFGESPFGEKTPVEPVKCPDHFLNWLQCLRSRKTPVAPLEAGYQHSVACILSDQAWETGHPQVYDHATRTIHAR